MAVLSTATSLRNFTRPDFDVFLGTSTPSAPPTGVTGTGATRTFTGGSGGLGVPADLAALRGLGQLGQSTAWPQGTSIALGSGTAHWDGNSWEAGAAPAPAATGATAGTPGSMTPTGATAPANFAAMTGITASPATAWTDGQHVVLADNSHAYWNGTAWVVGEVPATPAAAPPPAPAPPPVIHDAPDAAVTAEVTVTAPKPKASRKPRTSPSS
jgi:hypothetical protein